MIEVDFACGGEGFTDGVGLDDGHPEEVEEEMIWRAIFGAAGVFHAAARLA